jgi:hypothetical protein
MPARRMARAPTGTHRLTENRQGCAEPRQDSDVTDAGLYLLLAFTSPARSTCCSMPSFRPVRRTLASLDTSLDRGMDWMALVLVFLLKG